MAPRGGSTETVEPTPVPEVEVPTATNDEVEDTSGATEGTAEKPAKVVKQPARGDLPEGYVTPVGLAKILTEKGLHTDRSGAVVPVAPQMVYSYIKNAPKDDKFPLESVKDSLGKDRDAVLVTKAIEWWERKNKRVAERQANAKAKLEKKAEAAAKKEAAGAEGSTEQAPQATEAE